jgi:methyl-accepting chemotaxis protein WspA
MKNLSVRARIIAGLSAIVIIIGALGAFAELQLNRIGADAGVLITDSLPGLYYTMEIEGETKEHHIAALQIGLAAGASEKQRYQAALARERADVESLITQHEATITDEEDRKLVAPLREAWNAYTAATDAFLNSGSAADPQANLQQRYEQLTQIIHPLVEFDKQNGTAAAQQITGDVSSAMRAIGIGLVISLLLAAVTGVTLTRAISRPLNEVVSALEVLRGGDLSKKLTLTRRDEFGIVADGFNRMSADLTSLIGQVQHSGVQVGTSVAEIAATSRQQQATANEVAATITEIGATSTEISATSRELAKTMKDVMETLDTTASVATSGQKGLNRMGDTMRQIVDASGSINAKLAVLNDKAANIGTVVTTITKVADQTNLLSLNAAIEAEKAGEYGRGFAVVATEIRRLADQTAVATYDIEQMVKEIQSATSAGVMGMDKFSEEVRRGVEVVREVGDQLTQIIVQVQALAPSFETVNEGMQSQSVAAQQISEALSQLTEGAQQTVESLRQSTTALEQLNLTARDLQTGVSRFTLAA